jgi:DnaA family protein
VQLPLNIQLPDAAFFDSYIPGDNGLLLELLRQMAQKQGELQLYCWAESGLGKTHLLQACCHLAAEQGYAPCYLPLDQFVSYPPDVLEGLEMVDILCIDDLQRIVGNAAWEQAVFSLINGCRSRQTRLVFAADANIHELPWGLPDLASRLSWGPVFQLRALDDPGKLAVLQTRARRRGIELSEDAGQYMLRRFPRDIPYLCELLDTLDRASLAAQRRLTIPFIKTILERR